ncbi:hypothetical protein LUZ60_002480 [Juncus effusus]|nr:hypothetical protein LUZ60_002480 [Juncus effusus]
MEGVSGDPSPVEISGESPPPEHAGKSGEVYRMGDAKEIVKAMETVERNSAAIAESFASLFDSLKLALSEATSTSIENMECYSEVIGRLQESALDAASKGNKYINSCLRLNEEMRGLESLAMQLNLLRKNVDSLDLAVTRLLRLP